MSLLVSESLIFLLIIHEIVDDMMGTARIVIYNLHM